eukprot:5499706-Prymnesium_polylepis.1
MAKTVPATDRKPPTSEPSTAPPPAPKPVERQAPKTTKPAAAAKPVELTESAAVTTATEPRVPKPA